MQDFIATFIFFFAVIDPIGSYLGSGVDAHRNNNVRSVLAPIALLAEKHDLAVLLVVHTRKGTASHTEIWRSVHGRSSESAGRFGM